MPMKDGVCPKCQGAEVYSNSHGPLQVLPHRLPITVAHAATLESYVCVECGYVERYVPQPRDLQKVRDYWARVGKASPARRERGNLPLPATPPGASIEQLPIPASERDEG